MLLTFACSADTTEVARVSAITVTPPSATVRVGSSLPLLATLRDARGAVVGGQTAFWSSSDTAVATISTTGVLTTRKPGALTVAASAQGISATAAIMVVKRDVATVQLTPAALALRVGESAPVAAQLLDAEGGALVDRTVVWTSSNGAVATVDASGLVVARSTGVATITASSEGKTGGAIVTVSLAPVASVSILPSPANVVAGSTLALAATTRDAAGTVVTGRTVVWTTADSRVALVSSTGILTGVAAGTTTVTATAEGRTTSATVNVQQAPVATVLLTPPTSVVTVGSAVQLFARLEDASGNALAGRTVAFTTSNPTVATVDPNGLVTARAVGTVTVSATSEGKTGTATVRVDAIAVVTVDLSPTTATIAPGATLQLTATPRSASGVALAGRAQSWRTSAAAIATVNANGAVTGVSAGTAIVTVDIEGISASASVFVRTPAVASVTVTPLTANVAIGGNVQLTATLRDANGAVLTRNVTWTSSNESVAFVTSTGNVIALAPGQVTITATSEGVSATSRITVF